MNEEHLSVEHIRRLAEWGLAGDAAVTALSHLSRCQTCRQSLSTLPPKVRGPIEQALGEEPETGSYPLSSYSGALDAAFSKISEESRDLDRQRRLAPALLADLEGLSRTQQRLLIGNSPRYQSWAVAEELLLTSRRLWTEDPRKAEHHAWVAIEITDTLPVSGFRQRILNDLRAEAWSYLGNCLRIQSKLREAKEAFSEGARFLEIGTGDPFERAQFDNLRASLLVEERRFDEAIQLLQEVTSVYRGGQDERLEARALLTLAKVLGDSGNVEQSLETTSRAVHLLKDQDDAWLELVSRLQLTHYLNEAGRSLEAQSLLPEVRRLVRESGNRLERLRLLWIEGRIQQSLGNTELAEAALKQVRQGFIDAEIGYDVALASLDLAALYLKTGRTAEVKELAAEMLPQFAARQIHREALAAIALFEQAARKERATLALVQEISSKVKDASTRRTPPQDD